MGLLEKAESDKYVFVNTNNRYISKPTSRMVLRAALIKQCKEKCSYYDDDCLKMLETEKNIDCLEAWYLTRGKGIKMY